MSLKVVNGDVWVPNRVRDQQNGFLWLLRTANQSKLVFATLKQTENAEDAYDNEEDVMAGNNGWKKLRIQSVPHPSQRKTPLQRQQVHLTIDLTAPEPVLVSLFYLSKDTSKPVVFVTNGRLTNERIQAAIACTSANQQHVFLTSVALEEDGGTVQLALGRSPDSFEELNAGTNNSDDAQPTREGFTVSFSPSEALQKELEAKAHFRAKEEKKFIVQLKKLEKDAMIARMQRQVDLQKLRQDCAERRVARFLVWCVRQKRALKEQIAREKEEKRLARLAFLDQRMRARAETRKRKILERVRGIRIQFTTTSPKKMLVSNNPKTKREDTTNKADRSNKTTQQPDRAQKHCERVEHYEQQEENTTLALLMHQFTTQAQTRLQQRMHQLQQDKLHRSRDSPTSADRGPAVQSVRNVIDPELIRAIQFLHFKSTS